VRAIPTPTLCQGLVEYPDVTGGITTVTPADLTKLDPLGLGINRAVLDSTNHTAVLR